MAYLDQFLIDNPDLKEEDFIKAIQSNTPSSFDVVSSNSTLKGLSPAPEVTEPNNFQLEPWDINKAPDVTGSMNPPVPEQSPITVPNPPVEQQRAGKENTKESASTPLDALQPPSSQDNEARQAFLESERKKHLLGTIPVALGGVAEALGNAAVPFGGKGSTGGAAAVEKTLETGEAERKKAFEQKLKDDPSSQISRHYRDVVAKMMGTDATNPQIKDLSASQIAQTLPEVEKFMVKEMQIEAIKSNRELAQSNRSLALGEKEDQFNQRRWERFGAAVNPLNAGSRRALGVAASNNMRADRLLATVQNQNISSQDISNIIADLQGIYKGGVPDQVMLQHGDYPSLQRKAGELISEITGKPSEIHNPALINKLASLTRELKSVDNKIIDDNLGINRVIFDELEKADPEKFKRALAAIENTKVGVADEGQATPAQGGGKPSLNSFYR